MATAREREAPGITESGEWVAGQMGYNGRIA